MSIFPAKLFPIVFLSLILISCAKTISSTGSRENKQVRIELQVPESTPSNETLYLAGSFNNWNPADSAYRFQPGAEGLYTLTFQPDTSREHAFKITRGSWQKTETTAEGEDIANREQKFRLPGLYQFQVEGWKDQLTTSKVRNTASPNVQLLSEAFPMPQLGRSRRIWLYLPPTYDNSQKRYPVLYLHDGQNLFDQASSFSGEWGIDESLDSLLASGQAKECIVVGIDNGGSHRLAEYSPWPNAEYGGGEGKAYMQFISQTLKPYIDQHYRSLPAAEHTVLGGSSLGALISLYGVLQYPESFGKALLFSPAFWFNEPELFTYVEEKLKASAGQQFYLLAGEKESETMVPLMQRMGQLLKEKGVPAEDIALKARPEGEHKEWFWKEEFPAAYRWLFGR